MTKPAACRSKRSTETPVGDVLQRARVGASLRRRKWHDHRPGRTSAQLALEDRVDLRRIRLALDAAMTLPTSELKAFSLPALYSATIAGVRGEGVVDDLLDRAFVGDLAQAFLSMIASRIALRPPTSRRRHPWRSCRRSCRRQCAAATRASCGARNRRLRDLDLGLVQRRRDLAEDPVGDDLRLAAAALRGASK